MDVPIRKKGHLQPPGMHRCSMHWHADSMFKPTTGSRLHKSAWTTTCIPECTSTQVRGTDKNEGCLYPELGIGPEQKDTCGGRCRSMQLTPVTNSNRLPACPLHTTPAHPKWPKTALPMGVWVDTPMLMGLKVTWSTGQIGRLNLGGGTQTAIKT